MGRMGRGGARIGSGPPSEGQALARVMRRSTCPGFWTGLPTSLQSQVARRGGP
jgi:hypothetical protein